jgi:hypothetical protein
MPLTGSCLCGDVSFEIQGELEPLCHCHCSMCRKSHGAAFVSFASVPRNAFRWTRGESGIRKFESSPGAERSFCSRCGSMVPAVAEGMGRVFVPVGLIAGDFKLGPLPHVFVGSKAPWYTISDSQPQFEAYPPGMGDALPSPRKTEPTPEAIRGGCLCGAVAYETPRPTAGPIFLCHCTRCRRARGAAHNANLFVEAERFRWLRGADKVVAFKLPEAQRFGQSFCRDCGSAVPHVNPIGRAVIPAGTLDDDPGVRPGLHIFVASKAPWVEIHDDLPRYDEYPPPA